MKPTLAWVLSAGVTALAGTQLIDPVLAQSSGGPYRMDSAVIAAGGGTLSGGGFQLRGTFGQALTGGASGPGYALNAGFVGSGDSIFHNGFEGQ